MAALVLLSRTYDRQEFSELSIDRVIATQGPGRYLLIESEEETEERPQGRVLDVNASILYPPWPVFSIIARGYWERYDGGQHGLGDLLEGIEVRRF